MVVEATIEAECPSQIAVGLENQQRFGRRNMGEEGTEDEWIDGWMEKKKAVEKGFRLYEVISSHDFVDSQKREGRKSDLTMNLHKYLNTSRNSKLTITTTTMQ